MTGTEHVLAIEAAIGDRVHRRDVAIQILDAIDDLALRQAAADMLYGIEKHARVRVWTALHPT